MTSYICCRECCHVIADSDDWVIDDVHGLIICRHCGATVWGDRVIWHCPCCGGTWNDDYFLEDSVYCPFCDELVMEAYL